MANIKPQTFMEIKVMFQKKIITAIMVFAIIGCATPKSANYYYNRGVDASASKNYAEAVTNYDEALKIDPKLAKAAYNAGLAYMKQGNKDKALEYFRKTVEIQENHLDAWNNIAVIAFEMKDYQLAYFAADKNADTKELKKSALNELRKNGFLYDFEPQLKNQEPPQFPDFIQNRELPISVNLKIRVNESGKAEIICDEPKEPELCKYLTDFYSKKEYIPAYDFQIKKTTARKLSLMINFNSDKTVNASEIMGAIDRAVIDGHIRKNLAKIYWCYEKELNKNPALAGKIVINFVISSTGNVSLSKLERSTMNAPAVESCVADQIKKIKFPEPKGGGIVVVNYPFIFKNSEQ